MVRSVSGIHPHGGEIAPEHTFFLQVAALGAILPTLFAAVFGVISVVSHVPRAIPIVASICGGVAIASYFWFAYEFRARRLYRRCRVQVDTLPIVPGRECRFTLSDAAEQSDGELSIRVAKRVTTRAVGHGRGRHEVYDPEPLDVPVEWHWVSRTATLTQASALEGKFEFQENDLATESSFATLVELVLIVRKEGHRRCAYFVLPYRYDPQNDER